MMNFWVDPLASSTLISGRCLSRLLLPEPFGRPTGRPETRLVRKASFVRAEINPARSRRQYFHRGRELAYASPPAQIPACALTHGAPASDDDEAQLARLRVLKPIAVTRETPTQSRLRKCVLHRLVGSAEWSFPPAVGFSRRHERLGIPAGPAALDARHTPPGSSALLSYPVNLM